MYVFHTDLSTLLSACRTGEMRTRHESTLIGRAAIVSPTCLSRAWVRYVSFVSCRVGPRGCSVRLSVLAFGRSFVYAAGSTPTRTSERCRDTPLVRSSIGKGGAKTTDTCHNDIVISGPVARWTGIHVFCCQCRAGCNRGVCQQSSLAAELCNRTHSRPHLVTTAICRCGRRTEASLFT